MLPHVLHWQIARIEEAESAAETKGTVPDRQTGESDSCMDNALHHCHESKKNLHWRMSVGTSGTIRGHDRLNRR